jgi:GNAT superfamily N-acetyltransferase
MRQMIKNPAACSPQELQEFKAMLIKSEQEVEEGLSERVAQAELLGLYYDDENLVAVAALKHPVAGYKKGLFKKAGVLIAEAEKYELEFGWAFILPEYRNRGFGSDLMERLIRNAGSGALLATIRTSDEAMAESLKKLGFKKAGEPFSKRSHRYTYDLYLREAKEVKEK